SELGALFSLQSDTLAPEDRTQGGGICVNPETQVRTRDKQSGNILPHGERGEIEIKTPSRMVGYLNNPEATQTAFTEDGFFKTGDLGYTRDDGSWVFLSRLGDAIRLSGFLVSPAEIEGYIETHPAVSEAQVVGVQQARKIWLCAFIIPADANKLDNQLLRQYCEKGMAKYKVPQHFEPIDAFPVTLSANGNKIQRAKLRDMAESIMRRSLAPAT
ncbi:MAG TPA: acyl-CoA synthetase, partial [Porticoccaceae bacterium]|nr:acyl-CoA synthetase [Porticoccaceae bacterium]